MPEPWSADHTLNGNLVEMLRLARADKQKPALGDEDGLKQVKLVAGAHTHREYTALKALV